MRPCFAKLFRWIVPANFVSSNLSIGIAAAFVLVTAAVSLAVDRPLQSGAFGGGWMLRGSLEPADAAPAASPAHAARQKVPHLARLST